MDFDSTLISLDEIRSDADYTSNPIWELVNVSATNRDTSNRFDSMFDDYSCDDVSYNVFLRRRPMYFLINAIFPCLVLNLINLLVLAMPYASQINICLSIFLTFSIYSLRISGEIPVQSEYLPMVSVYFIVSVVFILLTLCWVVLENQLRAKLYLPAWLMFDLRRLNPKSRRMINETKKSDADEVEEAQSADACEKCEPKRCSSCRSKKISIWTKRSTRRRLSST
jgi:hypothetical protein